MFGKRGLPHQQSRKLVSIPILIGVLSLTLGTLSAGPAAADHPGYDPSYVGQYVAVATENGTECWIGVEEVDHAAEIWWLHWDVTPCPDNGEEETLEGKEETSTAYAGSWAAHVGARVERFRSGKIVTGSDTTSRQGGGSYGVPAGWLADYHQLWASDGGSWWVCKDSGWSYSSYWTHLFVPSINWGFAPCGQGLSYANWGGGYQWTGSEWNGTWAWSGTVFVPCYYCLAAASAPETPPLPKLKPLVPNGHPKKERG